MGFRASDIVTVGEAAQRIGCQPKAISDLFYLGKLDRKRCPVVGQRRLIPVDYLPVVEQVLRTCGKLPQEQEARV